MKKSEVNRFNRLYDRHQKTLKLQGKAKKTIDAYSRAVRRVRDYFDCCPDKLKPKDLEDYFADLVESHSWSTVKTARRTLFPTMMAGSLFGISRATLGKNDTGPSRGKTFCFWSFNTFCRKASEGSGIIGFFTAMPKAAVSGSIDFTCNDRVTSGLFNNRIRSWFVPHTIYPYSLDSISLTVSLEMIPNLIK